MKQGITLLAMLCVLATPPGRVIADVILDMTYIGNAGNPMDYTGLGAGRVEV